MEWIDINKEEPKVEGKYVVKTRTIMGNTNIFETSCNLNEKNKMKFSTTNQVVTHWLKQF